MSSATSIRGVEVLRQANIFRRAAHYGSVKHFRLTNELQKERGSLPHTPGFWVLGSLCLGTCMLLHCHGSALRPFGKWARTRKARRFQLLVVE